VIQHALILPRHIVADIVAVISKIATISCFMLQVTKTLRVISQLNFSQLSLKLYTYIYTYVYTYIYKDLAHIDVIDNHRRGAGGGGLHVGPEWHVHH
jgi:hypothetical protein